MLVKRLGNSRIRSRSSFQGLNVSRSRKSLSGKWPSREQMSRKYLIQSIGQKNCQQNRQLDSLSDSIIDFREETNREDSVIKEISDLLNQTPSPTKKKPDGIRKCFRSQSKLNLNPVHFRSPIKVIKG